MKSIIFIAPPAAGKGSQSKLISKAYGIPHISTGDLLRNTDNEKIHQILKKGQFVDDEIVIDLLEARLSQKDCENGYILDGFPRNISQAHAYEKILIKLGLSMGIVIVLDLDKEIARKRIIGRRICSNCGNIYNELISEDKPKIKGICDKCTHTLTQREDDNNETFEYRYSIYQKETEPLIKHYEAKGIVTHVDSSISEDYTFNQIQNIIGGVK